MRKFIFEIVTWLAIEILVNMSGLSDLGNYGEFVFAQKNITLVHSIEMALIV
jgi:hypothetical protein